MARPHPCRASGRFGIDIGLRSIMETILLDSLFDLPSLEGVKEVVISQQVVDGTARPLYMYSGGVRAI